MDGAKDVMRGEVKAGPSTPLGASVVDGGVNFILFSRHASGVELALFDRAGDGEPSRVIPLDPVENRTYHYWHAFVRGLRPGQLYGYRVSGPAGRGLRFDRGKILVDPYAREICVPDHYTRAAATAPGDDATIAMKSVVVDAFELPAGAWRRWIDTSLRSPDDIVELASAPPVTGGAYAAGPESVLVLYGPVG